MKLKFALGITFRRAIAPMGGWRQRQNCPKAMAIVTEISKEKTVVSNS